MASNELTAKRDFVFIQHDSSKSSAQRSKVLRHVQRKYHPWRRRQQALRLRESSKFHSTTSVIPKSSQDTLKEFQIPPLLHVILGHSNSDPFDSLPAPITSSINAIIAFERDLVYPALQQMESLITPKESTFSKTWYTESQVYLHDNLTIYGFLARIAGVMHMATSKPEYLDMARAFRYKGVTHLRSFLSDKNQLDVLRYHRALLTLLFADIVLEDYDAMKVHVNILKSIFESQELTSHPSFNLHHFISVIYHDVQHSAMTLTPTAFNLDPYDWVVQQFVPVWSDALSILPPQTALAKQGLSSLPPQVRQLFVEVREIYIDVTKMQRDSSRARASTWFYIISRTTLVLGRLVNYYVNDQSVACLGAIYWLRHLNGIENVPLGDSLTIYKADPTILKALRELLPSSSDDLAIWAAYTGATSEQNPGWFTYQFGLLVREAGVESWEDCKKILEQFIYFELKPHGSEWFNEVLAMADEQTRHIKKESNS